MNIKELVGKGERIIVTAIIYFNCDQDFSSSIMRALDIIVLKLPIEGV